MLRVANMAQCILWVLFVAGLTLVAAEEEGCPPGTYVNGTACVPCPAGTYQREHVTEEGRQLCRLCTPGSYCSRPGLSAPEGSCDRGSYCPQGSTGAEGLLCPANFYCHSGSSEPVPCQEGDKSAPGASNVESCYQAYLQICPPGQYLNRGKCYNCLNGTFQPSWTKGGSYSCQPCPAGEYCATQARISPNGPCVIAGFHCPIRSTSPTGKLCPRSYFCPSNNTTPIKCPQGTTSDPGAKSISECQDEVITCPPGMYRNGTECGPCPAGTYQPSPTTADRLSACLSCDAGSYCGLSNASTVTGTCHAGYTCPGGSILPNEYLCPKAYFCPTATGTPVKCPPGTTSDKGETSSSCCRPSKGVNCGPGTYTNSDNKCQDCPVGSYQPGWSHGKGSYICAGCDVGKYCDHSGLAAPSGSCAQGYFCPIRSTTPTQQLCPIGYYCPIGGDVPVQCPLGTTSVAGSRDLTECTAIDTVWCNSGYYRRGIHCVPCPEGTYKEDAGVGYEKCSICRRGYYCPGLANTLSTSCPAGYYCPEGSNSSTPILCPEKHYCKKWSTAPATCGSKRSYPGSTSERDCRSDVPRLCSEGQYFQGIHCYDCPGGYYKSVADRAGVDSCLSCPAGFYCPSGSVRPAGKCAAGYFCPRHSIRHESVICPADHFCVEGSGKATPCPEGKESPPGSSSCL